LAKLLQLLIVDYLGLISGIGIVMELVRVFEQIL